MKESIVYLCHKVKQMTTNNLAQQKSIETSFYKIFHATTGLKVIIAFSVVLLLFIVTHIIKFPGSVGYLNDLTGGLKTLDLQASFSSMETYQRLEAFGAYGRQMYLRTMLTVDLIFPLSMFIFLFLFSKYSSRLSKLSPVLSNVLSSLAITYVAFDFLENLTIFILLLRFPDRLEFMASHIGYLTAVKRITMAGGIFLPLILVLIKKLSLFIKPKLSKIG